MFSSLFYQLRFSFPSVSYKAASCIEITAAEHVPDGRQHGDGTAVNLHTISRISWLLKHEFS
jgi:hypothetical protein